MNATALKVYELIKNVHDQIFHLRTELHEGIREAKAVEELVEVAYATREALKFLEEVRKDVEKVQEVSGQLACKWWANSTSDEDLIRTPICTGKPTLKTGAKIPTMKKDPERYEALMTSLDVPRELWETDVMRLHWPGLMEHFTGMQERGEPLPSAINVDDTYTRYTLVVRKGTDMDDVLQASKAEE